MQNIRVFFEKRGRAIYISHLDLMRAMSRAVRRAELPIWYTEGFHPHPYLSFPLPLPLGQEGRCEAMDMRLTEPLPPAELTARLNAVLPRGMRALRAAEPWCGPAEIAAAEYEMTFAAADLEQLRRRLADPALSAKKMGKQGRRKVEKEMQLAPLILSCSLASTAPQATSPPQAQAQAIMRCVLAAGSVRNLNPALLAEALGAPATGIARLRLLRNDGALWE
jgi:radical SAM-linked protein